MRLVMVVAELAKYLIVVSFIFLFFFFKQKTAYEIGTGDWSSDVCSSDLPLAGTLISIACLAALSWATCRPFPLPPLVAVVVFYYE